MQLVSEALLVLNPPNKSSGGTIVGRVDAVQMAAVTFEYEPSTQAKHGAALTDVAITGVNAAFNTKLMDYNADTLAFITNNLGLDWLQGDTGTYKIGQTLGTGNLHKLLLRPIDKAGNVVTTRPFLFIPRGFVASAVNLAWHRQVEVAAAFDVLLMGLMHSTLARPALVGDPDEWPAGWESA